jgi:RNA polymerase sigma-70 factor, ECF subfamily
MLSGIHLPKRETAGENYHRVRDSLGTAPHESFIGPSVLAYSEDQTSEYRLVDPPVLQITRLLHAWSEGDQAAFDQLLPLVYDDLHDLAKLYMARERSDHTLQTTALVHEAYLRLLASAHPSWQDKAHFFAVCARTMRRILVDWARSRKPSVRSDETRLSPQEVLDGMGQPGRDLVAVDDALTALAAVDLRKSQVVEMRFFGGLTAKEIAGVLKVSELTVLRDFQFAKSWLRREMTAAGKKQG